MKKYNPIKNLKDYAHPAKRSSGAKLVKGARKPKSLKIK
jgi:hypothetical protein